MFHISFNYRIDNIKAFANTDFIGDGKHCLDAINKVFNEDVLILFLNCSHILDSCDIKYKCLFKFDDFIENIVTIRILDMNNFISISKIVKYSYLFLELDEKPLIIFYNKTLAINKKKYNLECVKFE
jgi:hypothetical protein